MDNPWTPPQHTTFRALALIWRGPELLMIRVMEKMGVVKGYRPIGGGVEFCESSAMAMQREVREELGMDCHLNKFVGVVENVFEFNGVKGHEVLALWDVTPSDLSILKLEKVPYAEAHMAHDFMVWQNPWKSEFPIFPPALIELLNKEYPHVAAA